MNNKALSSTDLEKEIIRKAHLMFNEAWSKGRLEVVDEILKPGFVRHDPHNPKAQGPEGYKGLIVKVRNAFPDWDVKIHNVAAQGDQMWARITGTGTHKGEFVGIKATGAYVEVPTYVNATFADDGFATEGFTISDYLGLIQKLIQAMSWWQFLGNLPAIVMQSGLGRDPKTPFGDAGYRGWRCLLGIEG